MINDIYPLQKQPYIIGINNNKRANDGNTIKILKPAVIPISYDTQSDLSNKNGFNKIINYNQTEIIKNKNNSVDKIILPKKIFLAHNNDIILENNNKFTEDILKETYNDITNNNNKNPNPIFHLGKIVENNYNNNYSIPFITNVEESKNTNTKNSITYKPIVEKINNNNHNNIYSLPYITKYEEEEKKENNMLYLI